MDSRCPEKSLNRLNISHANSELARTGTPFKYVTEICLVIKWGWRCLVLRSVPCLRVKMGIIPSARVLSVVSKRRVMTLLRR